MVGWHHHLDGHEFEQTPGIGDGQGTIVWKMPWMEEPGGLLSMELLRVGHN